MWPIQGETHLFNSLDIYIETDSNEIFTFVMIGFDFFRFWCNINTRLLYNNGLNRDQYLSLVCCNLNNNGELQAKQCSGFIHCTIIVYCGSLTTHKNDRSICYVTIYLLNIGLWNNFFLFFFLLSPFIRIVHQPFFYGCTWAKTSLISFSLNPLCIYWSKC